MPIASKPPGKCLIRIKDLSTSIREFHSRESSGAFGFEVGGPQV